ncbi:MAG: acylphosphatase [Candidatus Aenigmatarchaeota archaeon]|nr:acylphosphatase [Candidatus Aenigmarchaeota archaeon]
MKRVNAKIYGIVQNVGFRNFIKKNAEKLGITGWVRNNFDGTVEAVFEGDDNAVSEIIEKCKKGPLLALVEKVEVREEEPKKEFDEFHIFR